MSPFIPNTNLTWLTSVETSVLSPFTETIGCNLSTEPPAPYATGKHSGPYHAPVG